MLDWSLLWTCNPVNRPSTIIFMACGDYTIGQGPGLIEFVDLFNTFLVSVFYDISVLGAPVSSAKIQVVNGSTVLFDYDIDITVFADNQSKMFLFVEPYQFPATIEPSVFFKIDGGGWTNVSAFAASTSKTFYGTQILDINNTSAPPNKIIVVGGSLGTSQCCYLGSFSGSPPVAATLDTGGAITVQGVALSSAKPSTSIDASSGMITLSGPTNPNANVFIVFTSPSVPSPPAWSPYLGQFYKTNLPYPAVVCGCED